MRGQAGARSPWSGVRGWFAYGLTRRCTALPDLTEATLGLLLAWMGCLTGVQAADLMFSTSSRVAGLCAQSMHNWLAGRLGVVLFLQGQGWEKVISFFLLHQPPV